VQDAAIVFLGVITFGLLHGINPSHGWMVVVLYSIRNKRPLLSSLMSSSILAGAHFLSSIVVVAAFIFVTIFIQIPQTYLNYAVAAALGILTYLFWKEKGEDLIETQHGHLHYDFIEQLEHEHAHWHAS
jgi:nickel/cobalt transporter (NicO) family protein